jgi:hypothetical protein
MIYKSTLAAYSAVEERAHGSEKDADVSDVNFTKLAAEMCALDGNFGKHSLSKGLGFVARFLLDHECDVRLASWYLKWLIPFPATADICC